MRDPTGGNRRGDPRGGGLCPPKKKTRIYLTLTLNVHTCCCGESMENNRITTMGRTWMGESRTALFVSFVGANYPLSRLDGMPRPLEQ